MRVYLKEKIISVASCFTLLRLISGKDQAATSDVQAATSDVISCQQNDDMQSTLEGVLLAWHGWLALSARPLRGTGHFESI